MPAGQVKKGEEKFWRKAKETANARARDDKSFKKGSDDYWAFVSSQFDKFKSGELDMGERRIREEAGDIKKTPEEVARFVVNTRPIMFQLRQRFGLSVGQAQRILDLEPYAFGQTGKGMSWFQSEIGKVLKSKQERAMSVADRMIEKAVKGVPLRKVIEAEQGKLFDVEPFEDFPTDYPDPENRKAVVKMSYWKIIPMDEDDPDYDPDGDFQYDEEGGWTDPRGNEYDVEDEGYEGEIVEPWDEDQTLAQAVADYLMDNGGGYFEYNGDGSYTEADSRQDFRTGEDKRITYHVSGLSADEENEVNAEIEARGGKLY